MMNKEIFSLKKWMLFFLFCVVHSISMATPVNEFPLRYQYPSLDYVSTDELKSLISQEKAVILDVRSEFEYRTLHIKSAWNLPLGNKKFKATLRQIKESNPGKYIVLYCNGETCSKSYKAGLKCERANIEGCKVYDSGIFTWVKSNPEQSELYGVSPVLEKDLINDEAFSAHLLPADEFIDRVVNTNSIVLDIRTGMQQINDLLPVKGAKKAPLESKKFLKKVAQAKKQKKPLLIFDATGKQIRWCMYYLEKEGIKNYFFAAGGVRSLDLVMLDSFRTPKNNSLAAKN